jgi:hypothetical protein
VNFGGSASDKQIALFRPHLGFDLAVRMHAGMEESVSV